MTVDLSDAARAALAAQTPAAALTAPAAASRSAGDGVPSIVLRAEHLAGVIGDGSTATDAEKASALASLYQLRFKPNGYPKGPDSNVWFNQSTQAQRDQINNTVDKSAFFKQAVGAARQFNEDGMAIARAGQPVDSSQTAYARFSQLSPDQQVLVWAGGASQFGTLEQYSAFLKQQSDGAAQAATSASPPAAPRPSPYGAAQSAAPGSSLSRSV